MKITVEESDMLGLWHDVIESLDIMRALASGEPQEQNNRSYAENGVRKLKHAREILQKITASQAN